MSDLQKLFSSHPAPAPRADLADRIVAATKSDQPQTAANDNRWIRRVGFGAIAATVAFGLFVIAQPDETQAWEDYAETAGFSELYDWVHADDA